MAPLTSLVFLSKPYQLLFLAPKYFSHMGRCLGQEHTVQNTEALDVLMNVANIKESAASRICIMVYMNVNLLWRLSFAAAHSLCRKWFESSAWSSTW